MRFSNSPLSRILLFFFFFKYNTTGPLQFIDSLIYYRQEALGRCVCMVELSHINSSRKVGQAFSLSWFPALLWCEKSTLTPIYSWPGNSPHRTTQSQNMVWEDASFTTWSVTDQEVNWPPQSQQTVVAMWGFEPWRLTLLASFSSLLSGLP
jgi:hypothetical protein